MSTIPATVHVPHHSCITMLNNSGIGYYVLNVLLLFSFGLTRHRLLGRLSREKADQELKLWAAWAVLVIMRARKMKSTRDAVHAAILYAKVLACISAYLLDQRIAILFASLFISNL